MKALSSILIALGAFQLCVCLPPLPKKIIDGFVFKPDLRCDHPVEIEIFLDMTCPDSKAAFPVIKEMASHYGDKVILRSFMFPLPYHRASWLACRSTFAINSTKPTLTYQWMEAVFEKQVNLYNSATANLGDDKIMEILARWSTSLGMKEKDFLRESALSSWDQTQQWKYGCSRGVTGTPFAFVNGENVDMEPDWTLEDWVKVIQPLVNLV